mmetsp:Transcript_33391/g.58541  ORF Transcript_33391/g.58541 Transcript_33391/m.58541 type:complete len:110 (+) Transcript_33391:218-547(+)
MDHRLSKPLGEYEESWLLPLYDFISCYNGRDDRKSSQRPGFLLAELEVMMCDWVADAMNLPEFYKHSSSQGGGLTQSTASESELAAMVEDRSKYPEPSQVVNYSDMAHF